MITNEDLRSELIYTAEQGKHRQFQFLRSWLEYSNAKRIYRVEKLLVGSMRQSANKLFKKYCRDITTGTTEIIRLLGYCTMLNVVKFYEEELKTLNDMIVEYECYLVNGNLFDFILGSQRPEDKLWDHRRL